MSFFDIICMITVIGAAIVCACALHYAFTCSRAS